MPVTEEIIKKLSKDTGVSMDEITVSGLVALLRERKRKIMIDRLDVLTRYGITSAEELEKKIKDDEIAEHPAWEDLILLENIEATITAIDKDIKSIQESS
ncbi:MAG: hypothetical protein A2Z47_09690 [Thermodesulfovibrio sp. RBG_19FT_COMBO_42_12]|nr:MAG: hypothetical protein A2Z47_09690 [Thermodesulfovibrio sp. RBG_19FT_COMBO_42_12]